MIEFGGNTYYIDIDVLNDTITPKTDGSKQSSTHTKTYLDGLGTIISVEVDESSHERVTEVSAAKYDIIRTMLDVVLDITDADEVDDTMGAERGLEKTTISFKIAFNTLYHYGILKEK